MNCVGAGVREIRVKVLGEWRVIYVTKLEDAVFVLHAFQKKPPKTSKSNLELVNRAPSPTESLDGLIVGD